MEIIEKDKVLSELFEYFNSNENRIMKSSRLRMSDALVLKDVIIIQLKAPTFKATVSVPATDKCSSFSATMNNGLPICLVDELPESLAQDVRGFVTQAPHYIARFNR